MAADRALLGFERGLLRALRLADPTAQPPRVLVAVSGGADSTALLLGLSALCSSRRFPLQLCPCHVDHGLRSVAERQEEQARLAALCATLGLRLATRTITVAATRRLSPEAAARQARYLVLRQAAAAVSADWVVTGHTADDQAETVLLRLLGGTGLRGLRAMSVASHPWGEQGPTLLRPLLATTHAATMAYCRARGVAWSEDSSNASPAFRRNRLRHEALPLLEAISPGAGAALKRLASQAGLFADWLDDEVARWLAALWVEAGDERLLRRATSPPPPFIAASVAAGALARLLDGPGAPGERQVRALVDCWQGPIGRRLALGAGWQAEAEAAGVRFRRGGQARASATAAWPQVWPLSPGETFIPGWRVDLSVEAAAEAAEDSPGDRDAAPPDGRFEAHVAANSLGRLTVRFWRPGDRLRPAGLGGSKKVQDVFVDAKTPRRERATIPLLFTDDVCIWVVGVKRAAEAPARRASGAATICVRFTRPPETDT